MKCRKILLNMTIFHIKLFFSKSAKSLIFSVELSAFYFCVDIRCVYFFVHLHIWTEEKLFIFYVEL
jgi:hypothetical protein